VVVTFTFQRFNTDVGVECALLRLAFNNSIRLHSRWRAAKALPRFNTGQVAKGALILDRAGSAVGRGDRGTTSEQAEEEAKDGM
jgi:hypothetical protein